jgi:hypothetical protein
VSSPGGGVRMGPMKATQAKSQGHKAQKQAARTAAPLSSEGIVAPPPPGPLLPPAGPLMPPTGAPREEDHRIVGELVDTGAETITELSPEEQVMFASLLTCGRRSKTLHLLDHTVVVESLCGDDDLRIGLYAKDYVGSLGEQRAYQIAVAAAGIRTIDGRPLTNTLYEQADNDALFDEKVAKVAKMYPTVIAAVYRGVLDAEKEFVELVTKLGKLPG